MLGSPVMNHSSRLFTQVGIRCSAGTELELLLRGGLGCQRPGLFCISRTRGLNEISATGRLGRRTSYVGSVTGLTKIPVLLINACRLLRLQGLDNRLYHHDARVRCPHCQIGSSDSLGMFGGVVYAFRERLPLRRRPSLVTG